MNAWVFNGCILIGWLMVFVGFCLHSLTAGLIVGGVLMLAIAGGVARFAGIYMPKSGP